MLWFGLGTTAKIVIVFLAAFFPVVVTTQGGVKNVSATWVEVIRAEGGNEWDIMSKVIVPASLPFVMAGIRLGVGRAVVGMVVAEMFTAVAGLGGAIILYSNNFSTDRLFVIIVILSTLGVSLTESLKLLEKQLARWKVSERAQ
jgi:NitT/TauT family transport system permease protein